MPVMGHSSFGKVTGPLRVPELLPPSLRHDPRIARYTLFIFCCAIFVGLTRLMLCRRSSDQQFICYL